MTVSKDTHGPQHDNFGTYTPDTHGGATFDEGFGLDATPDRHGAQNDDFTADPGRVSSHGELWDEFGWTAMPAIHGQLFDSDFRQETANDGSHGTWFDVFRGGTQVRYMFDGADYEGTVIDVNREFASVRSRDGQVHEVGLPQFLAFRSPSDAQVDPGVPASDAEAPSAHSSAAGGGRVEADPVAAVAEIFANKTAKSIDAAETATQGTVSNGKPKRGRAERIASDGSDIPESDALSQPADGSEGRETPEEDGPQTEDEATEQGQPKRKKKKRAATKSLDDVIDVLKSIPTLEPRR